MQAKSVIAIQRKNFILEKNVGFLTKFVCDLSKEMHELKHQNKVIETALRLSIQNHGDNADELFQQADDSCTQSTHQVDPRMQQLMGQEMHNMHNMQGGMHNMQGGMSNMQGGMPNMQGMPIMNQQQFQQLQQLQQAAMNNQQQMPHQMQQQMPQQMQQQLPQQISPQMQQQMPQQMQQQVPQQVPQQVQTQPQQKTMSDAEYAGQILQQLKNQN